MYVIVLICKSLSIILPVLISVAYLTLLERKLMGSIHQRRGPNIVGFFGTLQPFADGLKLLLKETIIPSTANSIVFILAPIMSFLLSLSSWSVIPFGESLALSNISLGVLYILALSSLAVYGIVIAGWSSNSKYAFLGALRSSAQMISYEVSMGLIILCVVVCSSSLNLERIVLCQRWVWFIVPLFPLCIMFFVSILAETNRAPFDLPEAEAELVSGFSTEYASIGFALFFLGEYTNMVMTSMFTSLLFLGGWLSLPFYPFSLLPGVLWLSIKATALLFIFIWVRAAYPRYRYDQLMVLGWKVFLPLSFTWLLLVSSLLNNLSCAL